MNITYIRRSLELLFDMCVNTLIKEENYKKEPKVICQFGNNAWIGGSRSRGGESNKQIS